MPLHLNAQNRTGPPVLIVPHLGDGENIRAADRAAQTQDGNALVILAVAQLDGHPGPIAVHASAAQPQGHIGGVVVPTDRQRTGDGILSGQKLRGHQGRIGGLVDLLHGDDVRAFLQNGLHKPAKLLLVVFFLEGMGVDGQDLHITHLVVFTLGNGQGPFPASEEIRECR